MKLNVGTLLVAVVAVGFLLFRYGGAVAWTPWQIAGLAIFALAFVLFLLARIQLGVRSVSRRRRAPS